MFSQEALVSMADSTFKNINLLHRGDMILNKFKKPTKVLNVYTHTNQQCVRVQLDNGTNTFYTSPNSIVLCHFRLPNNTIQSEYCHISHVHENKGYVKTDLKLFSPDSDVLLESYIDTTETHTLYSLQTSDNSQSYLLNHIIVSNKPSHY